MQGLATMAISFIGVALFTGALIYVTMLPPETQQQSFIMTVTGYIGGICTIAGVLIRLDYLTYRAGPPASFTSSRTQDEASEADQASIKQPTRIITAIGC